MDDSRPCAPCDPHVAIGDTGLDLIRQVLPCGVDPGALSGLALEPDIRLRHRLEAKILRSHRECGVHVRHLFLRELVWPALLPLSHDFGFACSTSRTTMRPSAPLPSTSSRSTPPSSAARSAASVALYFDARFWRRRSPSSTAFWVAASPRSFASSVAAEPISLAITFAASFASFVPVMPLPPWPPEPPPGSCPALCPSCPRASPTPPTA